MKLLQLNVTANWGSTGKIAEGIGLAAMTRGWKSAISYGRDMNPSRSQLVKVGNRYDVYAHYVQHRLFDREGLGSKRVTKRLIDWIERYQPDIIHLHNLHDHWLNYPLFFQFLATIDIPIVWTFHDCWAFTGGCAYFDRVNCNEWMCGCSNCPSNKNLIDRSKQQFLLKKSLYSLILNRLTIVPVSNWLKVFCEKSFLKDAKIQLIHNGIDLSVFSPSVGKQKVVLGVALPWSPRKGLDDIIKLRQIIDSSIEIKLIGLSPKQIKFLPNGIIGLERTNSAKELATHYSEASVFINPTYEDNFPTTNIESLACGTPVITYNTGGSPEAIDDRTGLIVDKGDVNALASAVMKIIDNPNEYNSENCRARSEKYFNKDIQFGKYVDLYESILSKK